MQYEMKHNDGVTCIVYISLPSVYECPPALFRCRLVANNALSIREATVRIPPTIAHVLWKINDVGNWRER